MLVDRLLLVQSSQRSIVTLIQSPGLGHRNPQLIRLLQSEEEGLDSTLQTRGIRRVKLQPRLLDKLSAVFGFLHTYSFRANFDTYPYRREGHRTTR